MKTIYWNNRVISDYGISFCPYCGRKLCNNTCTNCGIKIHNTPDIGVAVVIYDEIKHSVLLCKRNKDVFQGGLWCLPCGYMEYNESYIDAAIREVREETGYIIKISGIVGVFDCYLAQKRHTVTITFTANIVSGQIFADSDVNEARWVAIDCLQNIPMAFEADVEAIRIVKEGLNK